MIPSEFAPWPPYPQTAVLRYQPGKRGYPPLSNWLYLFILMHGRIPRNA